MSDTPCPFGCATQEEHDSHFGGIALLLQRLRGQRVDGTHASAHQREAADTIEALQRELAECKGQLEVAAERPLIVRGEPWPRDED